MKCPEGVRNTKYVKLEKALYGLKQSRRAWNEKLDTKLQDIGFKMSEFDHCIYIHSAVQIVIGAYVDDLVICGKKLDDIGNIKKKLSSFFPIKDLGEIDMIIGWKIIRERATRTLKISQAQYINEKIKSFGLENMKPFNSPLNSNGGILPAKDGEK